MVHTHLGLYILIHWLAFSTALWLTSKIIRGIEIRGFISAMIGAVVIGAANYFLRPILQFLALPLTILTLGLFSLVINGAILKISALWTPGFYVQNWGAAIMGAFVLAVLAFFLQVYLP